MMAQSESGRLEMWNEALREALDTVYGLTQNIEHGRQIPEALVRIARYIEDLRATIGYPQPVAKIRARELLVMRHWEHLDDRSEMGLQFTAGLVSMAFSLGHISDIEAAEYMRRIEHCPILASGNQHNGRAWCAYCGTIRLCAQCKTEIRNDSISSVKRGDTWLCSLACRELYVQSPALIPAICAFCHKSYDYPAENASEYLTYRYCSWGCAKAARAKMVQQETTR